MLGVSLSRGGVNRGNPRVAYSTTPFGVELCFCLDGGSEEHVSKKSRSNVLIR